MTDIRIENISPGYILDIVREMKTENLDFTFSYHPSSWTENYIKIPNFTIFSFPREKDATYFILKWKLKYDTISRNAS